MPNMIELKHLWQVHMMQAKAQSRGLKTKIREKGMRECDLKIRGHN
jgi:hypothetical protein